MTPFGVSPELLLSALALATTKAVFATSSAAPPTSEPTPAVDAPTLVREIQQHEQWLHKVDSLEVSFEQICFTSPKAIAKRRKELEDKFPNRTDLENSPSLLPEVHGTISVSFDQNRLRAADMSPHRQCIYVWDGHQRRVFSSHSNNCLNNCERVDFMLDLTPFQLDFALPGFNWLRMARHPFNWAAPRTPEQIQEEGKPEEFVLTRQEKFHGIDCYVLQRQGSFDWLRLYVGCQDHLLHGVDAGGLPGQSVAEGFAIVLPVIQKYNKSITRPEECEPWFNSLPEAERTKVQLEMHDATSRVIKPSMQFWMLDYVEVLPGCYFPKTQGAAIYGYTISEDGRVPESDYTEPWIEQQRDVKVTELHVNRKLPDSLFQLAPAEGDRVLDRTREFPIAYTFKKNMPPEEWQAIVAKARKEFDEQHAETHAMDALVGQPAPAFLQTDWINSKPLAWADLKDHYVLVDFFADGCGPCQNDLPLLAGLHKNRDENGLLILAIHPPGFERASIDKVISRFGLQYPICIDVPDPTNAYPGLLYGQYAVRTIPHSFLMDPNGTILGHGSRSEMLNLFNTTRAKQNP